MALNSLRLRRALSASSSLIQQQLNISRPFSRLPSISSSVSSTTTSSTRKPSSYFNSELQFFKSFRSSAVSLSYRNQRSGSIDDQEIGPDTILFEGCDYNHWLITMDLPKDYTPEQMVEAYVRAATQVFGSEEEAKKKIYACSTSVYVGFQVECSEETSEKFKEVEGVVFVLPDSYIDPVNKEYGGDKYVNGTIIPRPPPIQYGRREGRSGDRRPRFENRGRLNGENRNYGPPQNPPSYQNYGPPGGPSPQQNYGVPSNPPQQNYGMPPNPPPQQNYGIPRNPSPQQNYGMPPNPSPQQNYGKPPSPSPQQNYGMPPNPAPQQSYGMPPNPAPQQSYGMPPNPSPQQNYGPQPNPPSGQSYGQPQNYPPGHSYGQPQNIPPQQQSYGQRSNFTGRQSYGPQGANFPAQQNYGPTAGVDRSSPTNAPGGWNHYQGGRRDFEQEDQRDYTSPDQRNFTGQDQSYMSQQGEYGNNIQGGEQRH